MANCSLARRSDRFVPSESRANRPARWCCTGEMESFGGVVEKFVGDAVIGNPPGRCALLREKVMDDPPRLRRSVRALLDLEFDALLFGDGVPILHDARERLRELVATFPA